MRARSDRLIDNALVTELVSLKRDLEAFTRRQPTSGSSGVLGYTAATGDAWDYQGTVGADSGNNTSNFVTLQVTFTGDESQRFPIENLFASFFINGTTAADQPKLTPTGLYLWTDSNGRSVQLYDWCKRDKTFLGSTYQHRWICTVSTYKQVALYFKAFVAGTSPGTLSIVRTS